MSWFQSILRASYVCDMFSRCINLSSVELLLFQAISPRDVAFYIKIEGVIYTQKAPAIQYPILIFRTRNYNRYLWKFQRTISYYSLEFNVFYSYHPRIIHPRLSWQRYCINTPEHGLLFSKAISDVVFRTLVEEDVEHACDDELRQKIKRRNQQVSDSVFICNISRSLV